MTPAQEQIAYMKENGLCPFELIDQLGRGLNLSIRANYNAFDVLEVLLTLADRVMSDQATSLH